MERQELRGVSATGWEDRPRLLCLRFRRPVMAGVCQPSPAHAALSLGWRSLYVASGAERAGWAGVCMDLARRWWIPGPSAVHPRHPGGAASPTRFDHLSVDERDAGPGAGIP